MASLALESGQHPTRLSAVEEARAKGGTGEAKFPEGLSQLMLALWRGGRRLSEPQTGPPHGGEFAQRRDPVVSLAYG